MSSSVFPNISPFSFSLGPGNALRKAKSVQNCSACRRRKTKCDRLWPCTPCKDRGEAKLCEQYVKEPSDRPTGYTHVLDTSILANRVAQLEAVLSRLLTRVDNADVYHDLLNEWKDPLPTLKATGRDYGDHPSKRERSNTITSGIKQSDHDNDNDNDSDDGMDVERESQHAAPSVSASSVFPQSAITPARTVMTPQHMGMPSVSFQAPTSVESNNHLSVGSSSAHLPMELGGFMAPPTNDAWMFTRQAVPSAYDQFPPGLGGPGGSGTEPASKAPSAHEHDAALALEGMALGRDIKNASGGNQPEETQEGDEPTPGSPLTFSSFIHNKRSNKDSGAVKSFPSVTKLPSIIVGKYVITHFLEHVDFRWRCLHRPTFEAQYSKLSSRLRLKSTDFYRDELATLALYASCLAVGIHFLDDEGYRDLSMTEEQADRLAQTCWEVSYEALEASDWMQVHDIRSCQTIIIAGIYLSSVRRANQHWTLLGSATKVAMALGLCNVPDEAKIMSHEVKRVPPRWQSTIDREVARRVWYCLLELDWLFSMEYGFLYLISPEINQTTEPANVNDVDIKDDVPVVSLPMDTYTDMSYFLQRLRLFYPFMAVVQKARKAGRMRYSFVTEANAEIQNAIANMPSFFKNPDKIDYVVDATQLYRLKRECIALSEGSDFRLMRLHRYYFSAACTNPRYLLSKQTCLNSARRLLESSTPHGPQGKHFTNTHYWAHTYCLFAATVVTIIYLTYALPQELDDWKAYATSGIEQLRMLSNRRRTDLGETADTLQSLMNVQLSRRPDAGESGLKRNIEAIEGDAWEGWLPPDLVALARLNPGLMGEHPTAEHSAPLPEGQDTFFFDSLLDDLQFNNESPFIVM